MSWDNCKPVFLEFVSMADKAKCLGLFENIKELEEGFKALRMACERTALFFMEPQFIKVLDGVYKIMNEIGTSQKKYDMLDGLKKEILLFLTAQVKEDCVRLALRDHYKLLYLMNEFFSPSAEPEELFLVLKIIEATSRGLVTYWKPPQIKSLVESISRFVSITPGPTSNIRLALQFIINISQENPSFTFIGKSDAGNAEMLKRVKLLLTEERTNRSLDVLCHHIIYIYEPALPLEIIDPGCNILAGLANDACDSYLNDQELNNLSAVSTINELGDLARKLSGKLDSIFNLPASAGPQPKALEHEIKTFSKAKEHFFEVGRGVILKMEDFLMACAESGRLLPNIGEAAINCALAFLHPNVSTSLGLELYKETLSLTDLLWNEAKTNDHLLIACLSAYQLIVEQILKLRDGSLVIYEKLVFDVNFRNVLSNINLFVEVKPVSVQVNTLFIRLVSCLSHLPELAEEASKKLELGIIRALVGSLTVSDGVLPTIQRQRSVCLLELLNMMCKYSHNTEILNQLLTFVTTKSVSDQIAYCTLNGDERTIKNAITVTASTAFSETARTSITKSIIFCRENNLSTEMNLKPKCSEMSNSALNRAINLEHALSGVMSAYDGIGASSPNLDGFLTWYKLKDEMHAHELAAVNQNVYHLQETIVQLNLLITRQSEIMNRRIVENEDKKYEQLLLAGINVAQKKEFHSKYSALEKDVEILRKKLEMNERKVEDLRNLLHLSKKETKELEEKLEKEENCREELVQKIKNLREEHRAVKTEFHTVKKELEEKEQKLNSLEALLKEKEEEAVRNKALFDSERKKMDTIRGVIGNNFGNAAY